jgi:predicted ATP-grasp superfamily ATP-dependent carboligase
VSLSRVLLTSGEQHYVVAACRALRRAGFLVTMGASFHPALGHVSRYRSARVWLPDAHREPDRHVDAIRRTLRSQHHDVLIPGDEASLLAISERRGSLAGLTLIGLPPHDDVVRSLDKIRQLELAQAADIAVPASIVCADGPDAEKAAATFGYPILLKPARSQVAIGGVLRHQKSLMVALPDELMRALPLVGTPFLVQRAILGGSVFSYAGVFAGGALQAASFARYRRTWPPAAGSASYAETLPVPAGLSGRIARFLELIKHEGIFEAEFVGRDMADMCFIDFNPRVYGSLVLAVTAGANLPAVWCRWLLDGQQPPEWAAAGVGYRWEEGEVHNLLDRIRQRRLREALDIVRPRRHVVNALFQLDDPGPFVWRVAASFGVHRRTRPPSGPRPAAAGPAVVSVAAAAVEPDAAGARSGDPHQSA